MNLLTSTYETNNMTEFLAALKLVSGEEVLSQVTHVEDEAGDYFILDNPIVVEEVQLGNKIGAKVSPWMRFSRQETFIIPKDKLITVVECDSDVAIFYEISLSKIDPEREPSDELNRSMERISTVDQARQTLEDIFKKKDKL